MVHFRTPIGRVRGLGSAKEGTGHFWRMRLTSVALVPLTLFFIGFVIAINGDSYADVHAALAQPLVALLMALFVLVSLDHMRLGMQEIIEDYIHGELLKVALLMLSIFFCVAVGAIVVFALAKLAFGG
jgi:succinate dehydrogenase / fumarate reductase membrane anchor subunit